MNRILITIILLFSIRIAFAQNDYKYYDSRSLSFYYNNQWDSVISIINEAIIAGHDGFYLRLRLGVAYFEKGDFTNAQKHLEKAGKLNSSDAFLNTLIFSSYLMTGRYGDAQYVANAPGSLGVITTKKSFPVFSEISLDAGKVFSNAYDEIKKVPLVNTTRIHGYSAVSGDIGFISMGMLNHFGRKLSLYHSYTVLNLQKKISEGFPGIDTSEEFQSFQHQYYAALRLRILKGLFITPAAHIIYNQASIPVFYEYDFTVPAVKCYMFDTSFVNFWAGLKLSYFKGILSYELGTGISNFNGLEQQQTDFAVGWRPSLLKKRKNVKFLIKPGLSILTDLEKIRLLPSLVMSGNINERYEVGFSALGGNFSHSTQYHGYIVHNIYEKSFMRLNLEFSSKVYRNIYLKIGFGMALKSNPYYFEKNDFITREHFFDYKTSTISGGLTWKFY